jgi:hypothetical integral membrane protein (TIGR02206 family)
VTAFFDYRYLGAAFVQGGPAHLGALLVIGLLVVLGWRLPLTPNQQRAVRSGLAFVILANELFWHLWHTYFGLWTVQTLLPLNLCNLMVLLSVFTLLTRSQAGYEFIYLLGIPAAAQVLITPALGPWGFPHSLFFQIFISHGGIILAALYLTLGEGMRPAGWRSVGQVALWTTLYALVIFGLNQLIGSNYLFLAYKPAADTLLNLLGPWPWYILSMEAIGLVLVVLMYLPFHFKKIRPTHQVRR